MKRTSKLIFSASAALVIAGSAMPVLAVDVSPPSENSTTFCANLSSKISDVNNSISKQQANITAARAKRTQYLNTDWSKVDSKLADERGGWAKWRQQQFTTLEAKATTDAQKTAVQTYVTTLTTAISTRESANDAARTTYRNALLAAVKAQNATVDSQISALTSAVSTAEATAQSSCATSPNNTSIRTTFIAAMKSARQTFTSARKADDNLASQRNALGKERDVTIHANELAFKNAENAATKALMSAFPSSSSSDQPP